MSGILAVVHGDGAPIAPELVDALTVSLARRGPDAQRFWCEGAVALGHALLATADDAPMERQPLSFDGRTWLVADARVDARDELRAALVAHGRRGVETATDAELLLHAWHAWGESCVEHLIGDFAFVVWDGAARRVFGARDRFGVRPFFYALQGTALVVASEIVVAGGHPRVASKLDDLWIADFLLFKRSLRPEATVVEAIRRLPGGHVLTWSQDDGLRVRAYAPVGLPQSLRYRAREEYLERFQELFARAVDDRLRSRHVAVSMSGGLDSSFIAAEAKRLLVGRHAPYDLQAHTMVYDHVISDDEREYTGLAATGLGVPVTFLSADGFGAVSRDAVDLPEPLDISFQELQTAFCRQVASQARVAFSGMDADALLSEFLPDHYRAMLRSGQGVELARQLVEYILVVGHRPPIGLRAAARRLLRRKADVPPGIPTWVSTDLLVRLGLDDRWRNYWASRRDGVDLRPRAVRCMALWERVFEANDPALMHQPVEFLYPFADARLVDYLLAIPAVPWCADKTLIRLAARGVLPEGVRARPKTPVRGDVRRLWLGRQDVAWIDGFDAVPELEPYVDRMRVPPVTGAHATGEAHVHLRPFFLNGWLATQRKRLKVTKLFKGAERVKGSEVESVA